MWVISLAFIGILAKFSGKLAELIHVPALIGMMILGMLIGPTFLNLVPAATLALSPIFRDVALVTILLIAGLGINLAQIKQIGRFSILLGTIPTILEGFAVAIFATVILDFSFTQGAILGFIMASVSPAILVPAMVSLIKQKMGQSKAIPQMLLAGASIESTLATTFFTIFLALYLRLATGEATNSSFFNLVLVPITLIISIVVGYLAFKISKPLIKKAKSSAVKAIITFGVCVVMRLIERQLQFSMFNALLAVMTYGFFIHNALSSACEAISEKMNKIWDIAKLYLFAFVGMTINPAIVSDIFGVGILILTVALGARFAGILISLAKTGLTWKERLFCLIAYMPKATIQSTLAAIPLQAGVADGEIIEAIVILSILIATPLGAIGIKLTSSRLLTFETATTN